MLRTRLRRAGCGALLFLRFDAEMPRLHKLEAVAEADVPASAWWQAETAAKFGAQRGQGGCIAMCSNAHAPERPQRGAIYWGLPPSHRGGQASSCGDHATPGSRARRATASFPASLLFLDFPGLPEAATSREHIKQQSRPESAKLSSSLNKAETIASLSNFNPSCLDSRP